MLHTSTRWLAGAVVAGLALAVPAAAQRDPGTPPPAPTETEPQTPPTPERPAADRPIEPGPGVPAAQGRALSREEMLAALVKKEGAHRDRLAKIGRLRELAEAKGQTERLAQIADLERRENESFEAMRTRARTVLGDTDFRQTEEKLNAGRRRAQQGKAKDAKDANPERRANQPQGERPKQVDRPAQPERPAPAPDRPAQGERPKPNGDSKPAAKPERGGQPQGGERPKPAEKEKEKPAPPRGSNPRSL